MSNLSPFSESVEGFDIIGDVHGCAKTLRVLLSQLGYSLDNGVYHHADRKAVFVGDLIDRGPRIREALAIVRSMVEAGSAYCIIGNHEFNAVAYTTVVDHEDADPRFLRPHDKRNNRLIQETLVQFASYPEEWRDYLQWFQSLPLFLEFERFRVVHACWDNASIAHIREKANKQHPCLNDILPQLKNGDKTLTRCLDKITRGTSLHYPDGRFIHSRDGIKRYIFRTKFWAHNPQTYSDVVFQPDPLPEDIHSRELDAGEKDKILNYPATEVPVFFGHYWLQGRPKVQQGNLACLDYSAVKYGRLASYRYDGEAELQNHKFTWVYVDPNSPENIPLAGC